MRANGARKVLWGLLAAWCVVGTLWVWGGAVEEDQCAKAKRKETEGDSTGRVCRGVGSEGGFQRVVVVVAGMPRSGSSVVFNAARLLMEEVDPNTVSGWHVDLADYVTKHSTRQMRAIAACSPHPPLTHLLHLQASLLIKVHKHSEFYALSGATLSPPVVDLVLATHRDLPDVVRSLRNQGNWTRYLTDDDITNPEVCSAMTGFPQGRMFQEADWARPEEWPRVAKMWLKCYTTIVQQTPPSILYEVPYSTNRTTLELVTALASRLAPFKGWSFTTTDLHRIATRVDKLLPPSCSPLSPEMHPISNLHKGHIHEKTEPTPLEALGMQRVRDDPMLAEWRAAKGYR
eukprot:TRINITY_DN9304_c0_g1_i1.p1 TRINITY_DN9304_c0_g1~~TRINITY_DN9304_c0_g1_i1.p1  ORF type:complete len:345 (+),score=79.39 TRINITY_DN9304_c0_g1_i1:932-1966(+)